MKKIIIGGMVLLLACTCLAGTNFNYGSEIKILSDNGKDVIASISTNGNVSISSNISTDELINILCARLIIQYSMFDSLQKEYTTMVANVSERVRQTSQLAADIIFLWNPPSPQVEKKPEPIKKKGFWARLFGKR